MKDIQMIYNDCIEDCYAIGIYPNTTRNLVVNNRAKSRWGQATISRNRYGEITVKKIEISSRLMRDDVDDYPSRNTMMHEILHCVDGTDGHTGKWKRIAEEINNAYPDKYHITRCSDYSDYVHDNVEENHDYKYVVYCPNCGAKWFYRRKSKTVSMPERYMHSIDSTALKSCTIDEWTEIEKEVKYYVPKKTDR